MKQFQYILYIIAEIASKMDNVNFDAEKIIRLRCEEFHIKEAETDLLTLMKNIFDNDKHNV
jgi:hydroxylamine reductase (hybrid-cluster protein)